MTRLFLIADDLTGALDSGATFAARGAQVRVARTVADFPEALECGADVIAVATGTRDGSREAARECLQEVRALLAGREGLIFKKVDSRLKGHIRDELEVLLDGRTKELIATPAVPALGRYCESGHVTGTGIDTPIPVAERLGRPAVILDARIRAELDAAVPDNPATKDYVGAAGLAAALAHRLWPGTASDPALPPLPAPALLAIGSRDPITLAQVAALSGVPLAAAPNGEVPSILAAPVQVVQMTPGATRVDPARAGEKFAQGIARAVSEIPVATLFACGGESANAILGALGIGQLDLIGEEQPGVPRAQALHSGKVFEIVTKSGGFGPPDTVVKLVKSLAER
ncbi:MULTISPECIES: four-carbon acid sugar kinase family protein [unclassified Thioclava]|uniref:four-carbon acid sugar kinase family protein n=1 Tax=unclassified Thioclava TaxID=2621713 RepID=UPI000996EE01|nr:MULTISPECIES: four-carbon acid sugar kinase family protein [unclassified Thioclava]OOY02970.1 hypothetical protein BMI87_20015 [Thioclava sp. F28-4]OWY08882.1 hypothetical protein B6V72_18235 [Thioclava sp. F34-6]